MMGRILVVDDEMVTRRVVTHALKALNLETIAVEDGPQALQAAQEAGPFALAIVDINLPMMDGFEVVRRLKALPHMADVPMVIFTARNQAGDELQAQEVGAVGFLYKPFSTQELRDMVQTYAR